MIKINRISPQTHKYLKGLEDIYKAPDKLYYLGELPSERMPTVAIVGTRKPSSYGREVTERLAYDLAARGVVIVSGLALGVDAIAHKAALEASGRTIVVQANGLDKIYPATNRQLADHILASGGAIVSEYEPGTSPMQYRFLERNRIVSGLADAVVITEAASRSGTLNTAARALEQGKELFVVPGNITSPLSAGCNSLLQQGAAPALSANDILQAIAPATTSEQSALPLGTNTEETKIIELLSSGVRDGDELQNRSDIDTSLFSQTLTMMEINGIIRPLGANQWTLR